MTKIVRAPAYFDRVLQPPGYKSLFLAGGITGVRNWQADMCDFLGNLPNFILYNPRREFAPENAEEQILWEWKSLKDADAISFWFSVETLQPITLLELGRWTAFTEPKFDYRVPIGQDVWKPNDIVKLRMERKKLFVGIHPDYRRRLDVEMQLKFQCPDQKIVYRLEDLAAQVKEWL